MSEKTGGGCVKKPWSNFASCAQAEALGACPGGEDPNAWMGGSRHRL